VRVPKDSTTFTWSEGDKLDIPVIASIKCGPPADGDIKVETKEGSKRKIVICTDRIETRVETATASAKGAEAQARQARAIAIASADMGKRHAMMGLRLARRTVEAQDDLGADQKAAALKGIDDAIRELESDN